MTHYHLPNQVCTVYYVDLSDEQRAELNRGDWSSEIGRAYLAAKDGKVDESNVGLFRPAARLRADNAEDVWMKLQNVHASWTENDEIECLTDFPRSMDVGDVIIWGNPDEPLFTVLNDFRGTYADRCASIGFERATEIGDQIYKLAKAVKERPEGTLNVGKRFTVLGTTGSWRIYDRARGCTVEDWDGLIFYKFESSARNMADHFEQNPEDCRPATKGGKS